MDYLITIVSSVQFFVLSQLTNVSTREQRTIDLFFTNKPYLYKPPVLLAPIAKSDHAVLLFQPVKKYVAVKTVMHKMVPDFSPSNKMAFHQLMIEYDFMQLTKENISNDELVEVLLSTIKSMFELCFPLRLFLFKLKSNDAPWMNAAIKIVMKKRDNAYRNKNKVMFQHYRKKVKSMIRGAKCNYASKIENLANHRDWVKLKQYGGFMSKQVMSSVESEELSEYFQSTFESSTFDVTSIDCSDLPDGSVTIVSC